MRFFILFLLLLPSTFAYQVAISPEKVKLDNLNQGSFTLFNPNSHSLNYQTSGLVRLQGTLSPNSNKKISFSSVSSGHIDVDFFVSSKKRISIVPSLRIDVIANPSAKKDSKKVVMGVSVISILALFVAKKLSLFYFYT